MAYAAGQSQTNFPNNGLGALKTIPIGKSKLLKTQGSNQYANIYCGMQDKEGNLWFGTSDGLCRYNGNNIIPVPIHEDFLPTIGNDDYYNVTSKRNTVWSMLQDKTGVIWFGTGDGVYCYDGKNFSRFLDHPDVINKQNLQLRMVDCIFEIFATRIHGMLFCNLAAGSLTSASFSGFPQPPPLLNNSLTNILKDTAGNIWLGTRNTGLYRYDGKTFAKYSE